MKQLVLFNDRFPKGDKFKEAVLEHKIDSNRSYVVKSGARYDVGTYLRLFACDHTLRGLNMINPTTCRCGICDLTIMEA